METAADACGKRDEMGWEQPMWKWVWIYCSYKFMSIDVVVNIRRLSTNERIIRPTQPVF